MSARTAPALEGDTIDQTSVPAVEIRGAGKAYGTNQVLDDVNLTIPAGQVTAIIGPSGGGKSTLLRTINHLDKLDQGFVRVFGDLIGVRAHRGRLRELPDRTIRSQRARALLERVGIAEKADAYPRQLSGGQQQRAAIARALALEPQLILFDEPTSALDPELVGEVLSVIKSLAETGTTLIIVTHEISFAREVADVVVFLDQGRIVEQGPAADVIDNPQHPRTREFIGKVL